ncbi:unnamed protein product [Trifolium pratense]|uniref:Uncharacterized protein n=1 Tax=Trifolium pratense TaxID=57577 RepID=A0ACB0JWC7_TRIPR|nr:unnamed protein product [Trifolium pratense]
MKDRNKGVEANTNEMDCYYSTSDFLPCKKHPSSSSGGICAYCLKERLVKLVCSDCGEQRLSSCSCSDEITSNRNSCSVEVGSVGRVSFLIENEKNETNPIQHLSSNSNSNTKTKIHDKEEEVMVLRRSSSNCVDIKRHKGFWRIGKLFRKNKKKDCGRSVGGFDEKSEIWMVDNNNNNHHGGVSRSRSLCSFRGGAIFGSEDGGDSVLSGARSSISAARSSGVNGGLMLESGRRSGYSEAEPRRSDFYYEYENGRKSGVMETDGSSYNGVINRRVFSLRESDFKGLDESSFIDLKLDYSSESKQHDFINGKMGDTLSAFGSIRSGGGNFMVHDGGGDGVFASGSGGSCRISVNDRGIKRERRKSIKGWRWIFKYHSNWGSSRKRDQDLMFKT